MPEFCRGVQLIVYQALTNKISVMAIPKRGSRIIIVDGVAYRWHIRKKPTYSQELSVWMGGVGSTTFAVESAENPGSVLVVHLSQAYPGVIPGLPSVPVLPSQVAQHVIQALASGWKPTQVGSPFHVNERFFVLR